MMPLSARCEGRSEPGIERHSVPGDTGRDAGYQNLGLEQGEMRPVVPFTEVEDEHEND
jgi:hypothetical protein